MRNETATRRLTKRAHDFYGMRLGEYIMYFTEVRTMPDDTPYLWLNDNTTMQNIFAQWVNQNGRKEKLMAKILENQS